MYTHAARALAASMLLASGLSAQTSPESTAELQQRLSVYRHLLSDWAGLTRYGSENTEVPPPAPGEDRVVFIGDEITEFWGRGASKFFPGRRYFNRGIAGQTTAQMLVRFRQDVIGLKPKVVVIEGGSGDLASVLSPGTEATMGENITSMVELAKANGIRVVLTSITPVCDCFTPQTTVRPQGKIIGLNGWLKDYAGKSGAVYLEVYSALAAGRDFKKEFTVDGLLPNDNGYAVMTTLAERAIAQALGQN
jgi:lysophospholipase L1-like esterase